ncbi:hypothetical protein [Bifidobacterium vespertilionis]|uniref:4-hydroxybenzoate polyprenyltransferase n=1 Tax=Bifidobacterium vespertilionis TaxID=2562524 RepID=A0A5J5DXK8_9BIFI|nr:hypothetical protein [Bifidobacterium vespertilionis]KAA8821657.1 hypothetical protein EMO90_03250 [Bifidobacterium vespertilionis]KAA8824737.1 hypothetical protein EM848_00545 [Bifidobacterium vespertilionis]
MAAQGSSAQGSSQPTESNAIESGLPSLLVQGVVAALVACVGEIIIAPIYAAIAHLAVVPWAMVACLLAVAYTYIVGFALLWAAESLSHGVKNPKAVPFVYGGVGLFGFGAWGVFVLPAMVNSFSGPQGLAAMSTGQIVATAFNCAVIGFAAFVIARIAYPKLAMRRGAVYGIGAVTVALALLGLFFATRMYGVLY